MKRRVYIKLMFHFVKFIFWITFGFGIVLLSYVSSSEGTTRLLNQLEGKETQPEAKSYYNTAGNSENAAGSSNSTCSQIALPSWMAEKEIWQPIDKSKSMYSFSAYFVKEKSTVFIVGVRPRSQVHVVCQFWSQIKEGHVELLYENEADARALLDDFGYRFAPTIFECFIKMEIPVKYISLSTRHCETPTNVLEIQNASQRSKFEHHITVCVPPLIFQYDEAAAFIKWVEINKQLGVDNFVVYNFSSGPNLDHVLKHYSQQGLAEVIQWRPPMVNDDLPSEIKPVELGNFGQTTALNDCLYRCKSTSEFITNIGINEYIVPQIYNESTVYEMLTKMKENFAVYHVTRLVSQKKSSEINYGKNSSVNSAKPKTISSENKRDKRKHKTEISSGDEMKKLIIRTPEVDFTSVHEVPGVDIYSIPSWKAVFHKKSGFGTSHLLEQDNDEALPLKLIHNANKRIQNVLNSLKHVRIK